MLSAPTPTKHSPSCVSDRGQGTRGFWWGLVGLVSLRAGYWGLACAIAALAFWATYGTYEDVRATLHATVLPRLLRARPYVGIAALAGSAIEYVWLGTATALRFPGWAPRIRSTRKWVVVAVLMFGLREAVYAFAFDDLVDALGTFQAYLLFTALGIGCFMVMAIWHLRLAQLCESAGRKCESPTVRRGAHRAVWNWRIVFVESAALGAIDVMFYVRRGESAFLWVFWLMLLSFLAYSTAHLAAVVGASARAATGAPASQSGEKE